MDQYTAKDKTVEDAKLPDNVDLTSDTDSDLSEQIEAEKHLEEVTAERLDKTFVTGEKLDVLPESSEESDDSTSDKDSTDDADTDDGPTAAEKKAEAKLEAEAKAKAEVDVEAGEEKDDEQAKDADAEKGDDKGKEEPPQLSDAYYRAAIHRGWTEKDIKDLYATNPELAVQTLGRIYESVNRSSREFAAIGRLRKEQVADVGTDEHKTATEAVKESGFKGVDIAKLREQYPDDPIVELVQTMQDQNKTLHEKIQTSDSTGSASTTSQPSGTDIAQSRAIQQESAAIEQQIETFFKSGVSKGYEDFYGSLPKDATNWDSLTPGQKMNRWTVVEMMDQMVEGARALGREMKLDEALNLSHLSVTETIREKIIREDIKATAVKRSSNLTLKPSGTAQSADTGPKTKQELESVTTERLKKVFGQ